MMVGWHILEAWWGKYQNCRAGVTYLENGTGLTRGAIATATAELVEWGYFTRIMGAGKRPTEYFPNWSIVLQPSDANPSVLQLRDPWVLPSQDAKSDSVLQPSDQPHLPKLLTAKLGVSGNEVSAAPLAPPADAPAGTAAVPAGFEDSWKAYGKFGNKKASREAWGTIVNPDLTLIIERAAAWCASAKPGKKRMPFEKWLAEEKYDEADRKVTPVVKLPRKRAGATRRDAEIEDVVRDGRRYLVTVRWNDVQAGDPSQHTISMWESGFEQMLRDLDATCANDILYRRVLADFHTAADGTETDKWYRYPDAANDNLSREGESEDEAGDRNLHWKEAA